MCAHTLEFKGFKMIPFVLIHVEFHLAYSEKRSVIVEAHAQ